MLPWAPQNPDYAELLDKVRIQPLKTSKASRVFMRRPTTISSLNEAQARYVIIDPALRDAVVETKRCSRNPRATPTSNSTTFLRCSKQTTNLASINMTQLRATPVPLPPLVRQQHFAKLVTRHEHLRASQREALRQADHLFQTVLHQAFDLNP